MTNAINVGNKALRLGINVDHVATVRNARGGDNPDPVQAAKIAERAGADGITAHLREDRRHIRDNDIIRLKESLSIPMNLEMAATKEMLDIALKHIPHAVCIVPERRQEITTESGLEVKGQLGQLREYIKPLKDSGCRVSLFIGTSKEQIEASAEAGADVIELHTGPYCHAFFENPDLVSFELNKIMVAAQLATEMGLEVHAGHGLNYETARIMSQVEQIKELNIGHFLIGEAIFIGLEAAVKKMCLAIQQG